MNPDKKEFNELHEILAQFLSCADSDVRTCNEYMKEKKNDQFWRRTLCRSIFASMESVISVLKQSALLVYQIRNIQISPTEGEITERKAKIRFLPNLQFALLAYAHAYGRTLVLNKDSDWDALTRSVKIRDRIVHPKTYKNLEISDKEVGDLECGWDWFIRSFGMALNVQGPEKGPERVRL
jgi:hypothetical protein